MTERIVFSDGTAFACPAQAQAAVHPYPRGQRQWQRITVTATAEAAAEAFVEGASYVHEWDSLVLDDQGGQTIEVRQEDLSEYSVAGDIVDTRDGNVTVYMGKPTALELAQAQLAAAEAALEEGVNSLG